MTIAFIVLNVLINSFFSQDQHSPSDLSPGHDSSHRGGKQVGSRQALVADIIMKGGKVSFRL